MAKGKYGTPMNGIESRPKKRWCSKCIFAIKTEQGYTLCGITKQRKNLDRGYKCKRYKPKLTGAIAGEVRFYIDESYIQKGAKQ